MALISLVLFLGVLVATVVLPAVYGYKEKKLETENAALKEEHAQLLQTRAAYARCRSEGRIPVMGWNFDVVCLDKAAARWEHTNKPRP